jgi:hypothetical protein
LAGCWRGAVRIRPRGTRAAIRGRQAIFELCRVYSPRQLSHSHIGEAPPCDAALCFAQVRGEVSRPDTTMCESIAYFREGWEMGRARRPPSGPACRGRTWRGLSSRAASPMVPGALHRRRRRL